VWRSRTIKARVVISVMTVEEQLSGWYSELRRAKKAPILAAIYQRMAMTVRFYAIDRDAALAISIWYDQF
jgi:hypothetical protein